MKLPARGRAAGKVILLGEHAVVYGRPALAAGLPLGIEVEATAAAGPARLLSDAAVDDPRLARLVAAAAAAVGVAPDGFVFRVRSSLPPGAGLGSSAALSVAVLRALTAASGRSIGRDEELALATGLEAIFHGHPSGVDPAAAALGGCFRFVRGAPPEIRALRPAVPLPLVIVLGERPRSTGAAVGGLRERWQAGPERHERLFDEVGAVVDDGMRAAERGDLPALGRAFDRNQELLGTLGVSAPELEDTAGRARAAGALGAKLTGGGAGGAVIALAADPERLATTLRAGGLRTVVVRVGAAAEEAGDARLAARRGTEIGSAS